MIFSYIYDAQTEGIFLFLWNFKGVSFTPKKKFLLLFELRANYFFSIRPNAHPCCGDFSHSCFYYLYAYGNMRYTEYSNNSHTMDFYIVLLFVLYTIVIFYTQCGANRHTDIANFASLVF